MKTTDARDRASGDDLRMERSAATSGASKPSASGSDDGRIGAFPLHVRTSATGASTAGASNEVVASVPTFFRTSVLSPVFSIPRPTESSSAAAGAVKSAARFIIVSNRLPVTILSDGSLCASGGGLATGLSGPHARSCGLWIGWAGSTTDLDAAGRAGLVLQLEARRLVGVSLSDAQIRDYYERVANGVLWPLFHYLIDKLPLEGCPWPAYVAANRVFADAVVERYADGDLIWVHDYQLMLVPAMVRERLPRARIGFFLHIPFPSVEVFRLLPWREEILRGLLGADLVGFHTLSYLRQFVNCLIQVLGEWPILDRVRINGRYISLGAFPMGVDAAAFAQFANDPNVITAAARLRSGLPKDGALIVGVDRLDYTKGISRRLLAIERLLETHPELRGGKLRFVQVAVPSRETVPQ
jgi:trehalose 6-phosphate synthase/phosphatase